MNRQAVKREESPQCLAVIDYVCVARIGPCFVLSHMTFQRLFI